MRNLAFLWALLLAACVPDKLLFPGTPRFLHERASGRTAADSTLTIPPGEHAWTTAVRFPDGYDWELDTCAVGGTVWIDLYCDGTLYKSYPAGASIHPDMHRYAGGHLYTDYSTETETVVLCDGTEGFRFSGREALRGFVLREDGIHTLGQDRDGDGFTYRIDGREAFRSHTGAVLGDPSRRSGALTEDGDRLYYCFSQGPVGNKSFHIMREAEQYQVLNTAGVVYDVRFAGGKAYWVQQQRVSLVLLAEGSAAPLHLDMGDTPRSCRIVSGPEGVLVGVNAVHGGVGHSFIQTSGGEVYTVDSGCSLVDILCDENECGWLVAGPDGTPVRFVRSDGSALALPPGGFLAARDCALLRDGHLYLALSGHRGEPGRLIVDDDVTEISFNGYFTSVTVE
jgi:hypothetical protein